MLTPGVFYFLYFAFGANRGAREGYLTTPLYLFNVVTHLYLPIYRLALATLAAEIYYN